MKRDDLYIPAGRPIHDHMLSTVFMSHLKAKRGRGLVARPAPRSMPLLMKVRRYPRGGILQAAILNLNVMKLAQDLIMKRADPPR